jgi:hypothetical protein
MVDDEARAKGTKWVFNVRTGALKRCGDSHACAIRTTREWEESVRIIIFSEQQAVYIRFCAPKYDGVSAPTSEELDEAFRRADLAVAELLRTRTIRASWHVLYWKIGHGVTEWSIRS